MKTWKQYRQAEAEARRKYWIAGLRKCKGNVSELARITGYNRTSSYMLMRVLRIHPAAFRDRQSRHGNRGNAAWQALGKMTSSS